MSTYTIYYILLDYSEKFLSYLLAFREIFTVSYFENLFYNYY